MVGYVLFAVVLAVLVVPFIIRAVVAWRNYSDFTRNESARAEEFAERAEREMSGENFRLARALEVSVRESRMSALSFSRETLSKHMELHHSGGRCDMCRVHVHAHYLAVREFLIGAGKDPSRDPYFRLVMNATMGAAPVQIILAVSLPYGAKAA